VECRLLRAHRSLIEVKASYYVQDAMKVMFHEQSAVRLLKQFGREAGLKDAWFKLLDIDLNDYTKEHARELEAAGDKHIAEFLFMETNSPHPLTTIGDAANIAAKTAHATGQFKAHRSMSIGDIVVVHQEGLVGDKFYLCVGAGFAEISPEGEIAEEDLEL